LAGDDQVRLGGIDEILVDFLGGFGGFFVVSGEFEGDFREVQGFEVSRDF
jgi:hypothetical protein